MLKTTLNCWKAASLLPVFLLVGLAASFGQTVTTFTSAVASQTIPDNGYNGTFASMATKTVNVNTASLPAGQTISNVRVFVNTLSHTWTGDLVMKVQLPGAQVFGLQSQAGLAEPADNGTSCCGYSTDISNAIIQYDDAAANSAENMGSSFVTLTGTSQWQPNKGSIVSPYTTFASMITALGTAYAPYNGTWTIGIGDCSSGDVGSFSSVTVEITTVAPPVPCIMTCPNNITVNLDPGACGAYVNYDVQTTGDCFISNQTIGFQGEYAPSAISYYQNGNGIFTNPPTPFTNNAPELVFNAANPPTQFVMQSADFSQPGPIYYYFYGVEWTVLTETDLSFDWTYTTNDGAFWDRFVVLVGSANNNFSNNNFGNQVGNWTTLTNNNGANNQSGSYSVHLLPGQRFAMAANTQDASGGPCTITVSNFVVGSVVPAVPVLVSGLESGSWFKIGTTPNCFEIDFPDNDPVNDDQSCCFDVIVKEFPNPISALVCNDLVYVSLDQNCSHVLGADDVLEGGPYHCYDDYIVEVDKTAPFGNGPWLPAVFGPSDVGKTYQVRVTDPDTGNKCWGNVKIEDKLAPVLDCPTVLLPCNFPSFAPEYSQSATLTLKFAASDVSQTIAPGDSYTFNINVPVNATVNDVDFRTKINNALYWNAKVDINSPAATSSVVWDGLGGCNLVGPLFTRFDDEGIQSALCVDIYADLNLNIMPLFGFDQLNVFDGENAQGVWPVTISNVDNFGFGQSITVDIAELYINMTGSFTAGFPNGLTYNVDVFSGNSANTYIVPAGGGTPQLDNCSDVTLTYIDTQVPQNCASGLTATINRKWTAKDGYGNTSTCLQTINLLRPTLIDVVLPSDYDDIDAPAFHCTDNAYPTPDWIEGTGAQGWPHVFGQPSGCSINWTYEDVVLDVCDGTYKIRRRWSIIDWCIGDGFEYNQIIKVLDDQGPSFDCPANITISTDPFVCCGSTNLPDVIIEDNCSRIDNISGMIITFDPQTNEQTGMYQIGGQLQDFPANNYWDLDTLGNFGWTPCLPLGTHTVIYVAEDNCGNTSSCSFRLTVRDYTPPQVACQEFTTVAINVDDPFDCYGPAGPNGQPAALDACSGAGVTWVKASSFDSGSFDNCGNIKLTIQRMGPDYSDCIQGLNSTNGHPNCADFFPDFPSEFERATAEGDSIKFYCCEVGTTQTVILTAYQLDYNGNFVVGPDGTPVSNQCMIQVEVQDKIKPVCTPPANTTVSCENFDPSLWAYGKATPYDNCCLDTSKVYQGQCGLTHSANYSLFDTVCNRGTITRTFRAYDCHGFSSQCTQRVFVNYEQDYFVRFPNDVIVTVCDGTGNYGEPTFFGEDCELLGVSFEDEVFTVVPDACFKIERTWTIINWCTYNTNLPCVYVPNPNPNPITNSTQNLPGPIVSAPGTPAPWAPSNIKVNPSDATATNYSVFYTGGTYNGTTIPSIANNNCFVYKQIIKVIDTQAPTANCPASPVEFCDLTVNNPQLWNEMYWWDGVIGQHDLCEGPSDLNVTATDACSGANINIEYLLFLDLDGDGVMETVVSSTNLPGINNVQYGNASNPNFSGGTPRAFDERGVPTNQKYRFAIDRVKSGNNVTAYVRWDTQAAQANSTNTSVDGVVPELPYGTHKIKWIISDGCGNQSVCEYTFVVKDCKAPTVVCFNGLSVNIMPTGMVTLWATDFLQYAEDNCTPPTPYTPGNQLKYAIRKSGQGTGFPVDAFGQPITNVTFTCDEVGTQPVELWAQDAAGNAAYCETYVIIQDPFNNCGGNPISVSGALKTEPLAGNQGVEDAQVELAGTPPNGLPSINALGISDNAGLYMFANYLPLSTDYTVTPVKDDNPMNGVSTFDLVLMSKHILGIEPLNSPYKIIAADVNKSNSVTTFDIVELRKLILGIYTELPNNTSWRFIDKGFQFANPSNPFASVPFSENISLGNAQASQSDDDFTGIKIGDLNGSVIANANQQAEDRTAGTLLLDVEDREVKAGEVFDVTFRTAEQVQGFQFTMNLNGLTVADIVKGDKVSADNFGVFADALTTSIDGAGEFTVKFRADKAGKLSEMLQLSSRITRAEAYNANGQNLEVALRFSGNTIAGVGFELYQNQPNPWVGRTMVGFHLPVAATATLTVYDETGRVLFTQKGDFTKGYNAISLDRAMLNTTGVLYYKLETATDSATKKMIQTK